MSVILDSDQIIYGISKKFVKYPKEDQSDFLNRVSHLHHQKQKIRQIGDVSSVKNLTVLYLYDNSIEKIERLESLVNLEMLYLQRNRIFKMENLSMLTKLKKLFLSGNRISVVENIERLSKLKELYVDHQILEENQNLVLDPRSCAGLGRLEVLDVSRDKMLSLEPIKLIPNLITLKAVNNLIEDFSQESGNLENLQALKRLKILDLRGNPGSKRIHHWESIVGSCPSIQTLNGKDIMDVSKLMITNLRNSKSNSKK